MTSLVAKEVSLDTEKKKLPSEETVIVFKIFIYQKFLSVNFTKYDILCPNNSHNVGNHMTF